MKKTISFIVLFTIIHLASAQIFIEYFSGYGINLKPQTAPFYELLTYHNNGNPVSNSLDTGKLYLGEGVYQNLQIGYTLKNGLQFSVQGRIQKPEWNFGFIHKKNTIDMLLWYDETVSVDNPDLLGQRTKSFSDKQYSLVPQIGYYHQFGKFNAGVFAGLNIVYTEINKNDYYFNKDPYGESLVKEIYFNTWLDLSYQIGVQGLYNFSDYLAVFVSVIYHPLNYKPFYGLHYNDETISENKDENDVSYFEFSDNYDEIMLDYWDGLRRLQTIYVMQIMDFNLGVRYTLNLKKNEEENK